MNLTTELTFHRSPDLADDVVEHEDFHNRLARVTRHTVVDRLKMGELATTAAHRRSSWMSDDTHHYEGALAVDADGRDVGAWVLEVPLRENRDTAYIEILDPPSVGMASRGADDRASAHRRLDELHRALLDDVRAAVRRNGRSVIFTHEVLGEIDEQSYDPLVLAGGLEGSRCEGLYKVVDRAVCEGEERIPVRSGAGRLLSTDRSVRRMIRAGFEPVQVERLSILEVRDDADGRRADGRSMERRGASVVALPNGMRAVSWVNGAPEEWAAQMAELYAVFEETVPTGGASFEPEEWDVARLREAEATARSIGTVRMVSAIAQNDRLLAFTLFEQTPENPLVFQEYTVVRPAARGQRLAIAVKRVNADHLRRVSPDAKSVCTWNAVENLPMLAVNNAAGFVPHAFSVLWEARLTRGSESLPHPVCA